MAVLVVLVLALATVGAVHVGNGDLAIALAPSLIVLLVWAVWHLPLRVPMLVLLALAWALETHDDVFAYGRVSMPWRLVGSLLWSKLNLTLPALSPAVMSGFDLVALLLFAVVIHRQVKGSTIDRAGWVDAPRPIGTFALLSLVAVVWMSLYGLARGGSFRFVLWQSLRWIYLPVVYYLMKQALRGSQDILLVGRVVLGVGLFRACEAILIRSMFPSHEFLPHATVHHDSVLFATCISILGAMLLEMPGKGTYKLCAVLLPFYVGAIYANNRRLVWAEIAMVAIFFWLIAAWRPVKIKLGRALVLAAVPLLLYTAVGWNIPGGGLFGPVAKARSMLDSSRDTSSLWRDLENYNLIYSFSQSPLFGSGFGHPFVEAIKLPDVTRSYELEPYVPHNSVLGIWAYGGLFGFSLLWMVFPVGMFFTVRAYRWARTPAERVTALGAAAVQICYLLQGYADLGFGTWGPLFTVAASYALVGKICTASGAWGSATGQGPDVRSLEAAGAPRPAPPDAPVRWAPSTPSSAVPPFAVPHATPIEELWFVVQGKPWSSLAVLPAAPGESALGIANAIFDVGALASGGPMRMLDGRHVDLASSSAFIVAMTSLVSTGDQRSTASRQRAVVLLESVIEQPAGIPIALAADAVVLTLTLGRTNMDVARRTVELLGPERVLGCILHSR